MPNPSCLAYKWLRDGRHLGTVQIALRADQRTSRIARSLQMKTAPRFLEEPFQVNPGGDLLSHPVSRAVPSALEGLTSLFGMGRGVAPPP